MPCHGTAANYRPPSNHQVLYHWKFELEAPEHEGQWSIQPARHQEAQKMQWTGQKEGERERETMFIKA
jgi:hypothetical protein